MLEQFQEAWYCHLINVSTATDRDDSSFPVAMLVLALRYRANPKMQEDEKR